MLQTTVKLFGGGTLENAICKIPKIDAIDEKQKWVKFAMYLYDEKGKYYGKKHFVIYPNKYDEYVASKEVSTETFVQSKSDFTTSEVVNG